MVSSPQCCVGPATSCRGMRNSPENVYAFSEVMERVALLREFIAPFGDSSPSMLGLEDYEGLLTRPTTKRAIDRNIWSAISCRTSRPRAKVKINLAPVFRLLQAESLFPDTLRPLRCLTPLKSYVHFCPPPFNSLLVWRASSGGIFPQWPPLTQWGLRS